MRQTDLEDLNSSTELKTDLKGDPIDCNPSTPQAPKGLQVGITVLEMMPKNKLPSLPPTMTVTIRTSTIKCKSIVMDNSNGRVIGRM